jgi:hypothetical protein
MNQRTEPQKKEQGAPKKPETVRLSDPGNTPGTAEGDRTTIEEALGERPSHPSKPSSPKPS